MMNFFVWDYETSEWLKAVPEKNLISEPMVGDCVNINYWDMDVTCIVEWRIVSVNRIDYYCRFIGGIKADCLNMAKSHIDFINKNGDNIRFPIYDDEAAVISAVNKLSNHRLYMEHSPMENHISLEKNENNDKKQKTAHLIVLAFLVGLTIGLGMVFLGNKPETKSILVPSSEYATPYKVCTNGFPFVIDVLKVQKDGKEVDGTDKFSTWVAGHPLGQKQTIVCSKEGSYDDVWKPGMVIALDSADPT